MTPKGKAIELVNKFNQYTVVCVTHYSNGKMEDNKKDAKQCALITVNEIIKSEPTQPLISGYFELYSDMLDESIKYWQEVKQEIEKL
jgi:hypothetical protein